MLGMLLFLFALVNFLYFAGDSEKPYWYVVGLYMGFWVGLISIAEPIGWLWKKWYYRGIKR
jgi:hypothetical protein